VQLVIVGPPDSLQLHTTKPDARPAVQGCKLLGHRGELGTEVPSDAPDHGVDPFHSPCIQVVAADSQLPNAFFISLHGLGPHASAPVRDFKPQKGEAFPEARHHGFLGTERQPETGDCRFDEPPCLFGLVLRPAKDDEIVGVPDEPVAHFIELPIEEVESDIRQEWRELPTNNLAKSCLIFQVGISRERLRTSYGRGSTFEGEASGGSTEGD